MGNPLLNKSAFKFTEEEKAVSSFLPQMLQNLFPFKVKVCRNKIEDFFKLNKKDRKEALKKEAIRMRETVSEPNMGRLKKHVCVGLRQALRLLQRGELCLLILDQDHQTGLESVLATARASTGCAIMTVEGLGENICKGAIGYQSSAIGFRRSIANMMEFDEAANIARRIKSTSLTSENPREHRTDRTPSNAEVADHNHSEEEVSPGEINNVLQKRKNKTTRVFHPPTAHTLAEKADAGPGYISLQTDDCRKRKLDRDVQFEETKLIVVPSGKKKKKDSR